MGTSEGRLTERHGCWRAAESERTIRRTLTDRHLSRKVTEALLYERDRRSAEREPESEERPQPLRREGTADVAVEELIQRVAGRTGRRALAGLVKAEVAARPARGERMGRNPATGEAIRIAARPAAERGKIKLRPLKRLRDVL